MSNNTIDKNARELSQKYLKVIFEDETRYFLSGIYIIEQGGYFNEKINSDVYETHISVSCKVLINRGYRWNKQRQEWINRENGQTN